MRNSDPKIRNLNSARTNKVSNDVIVEKLSELSEQVRDVKKNVEAIEALAINSDKTLAVQAQQLAEHMRRTDALEELVHLNKQQLEAKDEKIFDEQKELLNKVVEVSTQISNIKTFVAWTAAGIGVIASIAQVVIRFMVK
jgi:cyclopropane fatty-acyl-phospholipid synthase-like methyltransferase